MCQNPNAYNKARILSLNPQELREHLRSLLLPANSQPTDQQPALIILHPPHIPLQASGKTSTNTAFTTRSLIHGVYFAPWNREEVVDEQLPVTWCSLWCSWSLFSSLLVRVLPRLVSTMNALRLMFGGPSSPARRAGGAVDQRVKNKTLVLRVYHRERAASLHANKLLFIGIATLRAPEVTLLLHTRTHTKGKLRQNM